MPTKKSPLSPGTGPVPDVAPLTSCPPSQVEAESAWAARRIADYQPVGVSGDVRDRVLPVLRDWVTASLPAPRAAVDRRLSSGVRLLAWCEDQGIALRPETALREATIERYLREALGETPGSSRSTVRTTLRSLPAALPGRPVLTPPPAAHGSVRMRPPYTAAHAAGLLALAAAQPTAGCTANVSALLLAGLGAGLDARELNLARGSWVRTDGPDVVVAITGRRPRTVPVRARYAAWLHALATAAGDG